MGARQKLNLAYLNGALIFAAIFGISFQSLWVFLIALGVVVAGQIAMGGIRLKPMR